MNDQQTQSRSNVEEYKQNNTDWYEFIFQGDSYLMGGELDAVGINGSAVTKCNFLVRIIEQESANK